MIRDKETMEGSDTSDIATLNQEIQNCRQQAKFWTDKLSSLEAKKRRILVLQMLQEDPQRAWESLSDEKRTKEIVLLFLKHDPHFFGECPWAGGPYTGGKAELPERLRHDRDIALEYIRNEHYEDDHDGSNGPYCYYDMPRFIWDDEEIVRIACKKHPLCIEFVSPRFRDNKEIALTAIRSPDGWACSYFFKHLSDRLKKDSDVLSAAAEKARSNFSFLEGIAGHECEKDIVLSIAKNAKDFSGNESLFNHLSNRILDNKEVMLEFVQLDGYCLAWCSERLRSDAEFVKVAVKSAPNAVVVHSQGAARRELVTPELMTKAIRNYRGELLLDAPSELQHDRSIVLEAVANGLEHRHVPSHFRSDPEIALKYLESSIDASLSDLNGSVRIDETFALAAVKVKPETFVELPEELQVNDVIVGQLFLSSTNVSVESIHLALEKNPGLFRSKERILPLVKYPALHDLIINSQLIGDKDFVLDACRTRSEFFLQLPHELRCDRDNVLAALSCKGPYGSGYPLIYTSEDFVRSNMDIVVNAIETLNDSDIPYFLQVVPPDIGFGHRPMALAWSKRGWNNYLLPSSPFKNDQEIVGEVVKNDYTQLQHAHPSLRSDSEFILSLVKTDGRALLYADDDVKHDHEILIAAIANNVMTVSVAFADDDFEFLTTFAADVRGRLDLYESVFVREILRGIAITNQSDVAPANRCHLPMLDRGPETGMIFKRTIAQFLGVPLGKELHLLRVASAGLSKCGY